MMEDLSEEISYFNSFTDNTLLLIITLLVIIMFAFGGVVSTILNYADRIINGNVNGNEIQTNNIENEDTQIVDTNEETQIVDTNEDTQIVDTNEDTQVVDTNEDTQIVNTNENTQIVDTNEDTQIVDTDDDTQIVNTNENTQIVDTNEDTQIVGTNDDTQIVDTKGHLNSDTDSALNDTNSSYLKENSKEIIKEKTTGEILITKNDGVDDKLIGEDGVNSFIENEIDTENRICLGNKNICIASITDEKVEIEERVDVKDSCKNDIEEDIVIEETIETLESYSTNVINKEKVPIEERISQGISFEKISQAEANVETEEKATNVESLTVEDEIVESVTTLKHCSVDKTFTPQEHVTNELNASESFLISEKNAYEENTIFEKCENGLENNTIIEETILTAEAINSIENCSIHEIELRNDKFQTEYSVNILPNCCPTEIMKGQDGSVNNASFTSVKNLRNEEKTESIENAIPSDSSLDNIFTPKDHTVVDKISLDSLTTKGDNAAEETTVIKSSVIVSEYHSTDEIIQATIATNENKPSGESCSSNEISSKEIFEIGEPIVNEKSNALEESIDKYFTNEKVITEENSTAENCCANDKNITSEKRIYNYSPNENAISIDEIAVNVCISAEKCNTHRKNIPEENILDEENVLVVEENNFCESDESIACISTTDEMSFKEVRDVNISELYNDASHPDVRDSCSLITDEVLSETLEKNNFIQLQVDKILEKEISNNEVKMSCERSDTPIAPIDTADVKMLLSQVEMISEDLVVPFGAYMSETFGADMSETFGADMSETFVADASETFVADASDTLVADMSETFVADMSETFVADMSETIVEFTESKNETLKENLQKNITYDVFSCSTPSKNVNDAFYDCQNIDVKKTTAKINPSDSNRIKSSADETSNEMVEEYNVNNKYFEIDKDSLISTITEESSSRDDNNGKGRRNGKEGALLNEGSQRNNLDTQENDTLSGNSEYNFREVIKSDHELVENLIFLNSQCYDTILSSNDIHLNTDHEQREHKLNEAFLSQKSYHNEINVDVDKECFTTQTNTNFCQQEIGNVFSQCIHKQHKTSICLEPNELGQTRNDSYRYENENIINESTLRSEDINICENNSSINNSKMGQVFDRLFSDDEDIQQKIQSFVMDDGEKSFVVSENGEYAIIDFAGENYKINKRKLKHLENKEKLRNSCNLQELFENLEELNVVGKLATDDHIDNTQCNFKQRENEKSIALTFELDLSEKQNMNEKCLDEMNNRDSVSVNLSSTKNIQKENRNKSISNKTRNDNDVLTAEMKRSDDGDDQNNVENTADEFDVDREHVLERNNNNIALKREKDIESNDEKLHQMTCDLLNHINTQIKNEESFKPKDSNDMKKPNTDAIKSSKKEFETDSTILKNQAVESYITESITEFTEESCDTTSKIKEGVEDTIDNIHKHHTEEISINYSSTEDKTNHLQLVEDLSMQEESIPDVLMKSLENNISLEMREETNEQTQESVNKSVDFEEVNNLKIESLVKLEYSSKDENVSNAIEGDDKNAHNELIDEHHELGNDHIHGQTDQDKLPENSITFFEDVNLVHAEVNADFHSSSSFEDVPSVSVIEKDNNDEDQREDQSISVSSDCSLLTYNRKSDKVMADCEKQHDLRVEDLSLNDVNACDVNIKTNSVTNESLNYTECKQQGKYESSSSLECKQQAKYESSSSLGSCEDQIPDDGVLTHEVPAVGCKSTLSKQKNIGTNDDDVILYESKIPNDKRLFDQSKNMDASITRKDLLSKQHNILTKISSNKSLNKSDSFEFSPDKVTVINVNNQFTTYRKKSRSLNHLHEDNIAGKKMVNIKQSHFVSEVALHKCKSIDQMKKKKHKHYTMKKGIKNNSGRNDGSLNELFPLCKSSLSQETFKLRTSYEVDIDKALNENHISNNWNTFSRNSSVDYLLGESNPTIYIADENIPDSELFTNENVQKSYVNDAFIDSNDISNANAKAKGIEKVEHAFDDNFTSKPYEEPSVGTTSCNNCNESSNTTANNEWLEVSLNDNNEMHNNLQESETSNPSESDVNSYGMIGNTSINETEDHPENPLTPTAGMKERKTDFSTDSLFTDINEKNNNELIEDNLNNNRVISPSTISTQDIDEASISLEEALAILDETIDGQLKNAEIKKRDVATDEIPDSAKKRHINRAKKSHLPLAGVKSMPTTPVLRDSKSNNHLTLTKATSWQYSSDYALTKTSRNLIESIEDDILREFEEDCDALPPNEIQKTLENLRPVQISPSESTPKISSDIENKTEILFRSPKPRHLQMKLNGKRLSKSLHDIFTGKNVETDIDEIDEVELNEAITSPLYKNSFSDVFETDVDKCKISKSFSDINKSENNLSTSQYTTSTQKSPNMARRYIIISKKTRETRSPLKSTLSASNYSTSKQFFKSAEDLVRKRNLSSSNLIPQRSEEEQNVPPIKHYKWKDKEESFYKNKVKLIIESTDDEPKSHFENVKAPTYSQRDKKPHQEIVNENVDALKVIPLSQHSLVDELLLTNEDSKKIGINNHSPKLAQQSTPKRNKRDSWDICESSFKNIPSNKREKVEKGIIQPKAKSQDFPYKHQSWNILELVDSKTELNFKRDSSDISYLFEKYQNEREALKKLHSKQLRRDSCCSEFSEISSLSEASSASNDEFVPDENDKAKWSAYYYCNDNVENVHSFTDLAIDNLSSRKSSDRNSSTDRSSLTSPSSIERAELKPFPSPTKPAFVPEISCFDDEDLSKMVIAKAASAVRTRRRSNRRRNVAEEAEAKSNLKVVPETKASDSGISDGSNHFSPKSERKSDSSSKLSSPEFSVVQPPFCSSPLEETPHEKVGYSKYTNSAPIPKKNRSFRSKLNRRFKHAASAFLYPSTQKKEESSRSYEHINSLPNLTFEASGSRTSSDEIDFYDTEDFQSESSLLSDSCFDQFEGSVFDDELFIYPALHLDGNSNGNSSSHLRRFNSDSSEEESFDTGDDINKKPIKENEVGKTERTVQCGYPPCSKTQVMKGDESSVFTSCPSCFTCYCTRACRRKHWHEHKRLCFFGRISYYIRSLLRRCEKEKKLNEFLARMSSENFKNNGRGCIEMNFESPTDAKIALVSKSTVFSNTPYYENILNVRNHNNRHANLLYQTLKDYDPEQEFIVNISIVIGSKTNKKRQASTVVRCARVSMVTPILHVYDSRADSYVIRTFTLPILENQFNDRETRRYYCRELSSSLKRCGVRLKTDSKDAYNKLCDYVDKEVYFTPLTLYGKKDSKNFKCIIYPSDIHRHSETRGT